MVDPFNLVIVDVEAEAEAELGNTSILIPNDTKRKPPTRLHHCLYRLVFSKLMVLSVGLWAIFPMD